MLVLSYHEVVHQKTVILEMQYCCLKAFINMSEFKQAIVIYFSTQLIVLLEQKMKCIIFCHEELDIASKTIIEYNIYERSVCTLIKEAVEQKMIDGGNLTIEIYA